MKSQIFRICFTIDVLLFAVGACQPQVQPLATVTRPASEQTIIALIQTSTALASTSSVSTPIPPILTQPEVTANVAVPVAATDTQFVPAAQAQPLPNVEASPTPYIPPTVPPIPTSSVPLAMLVTPTLCSEGPGPLYKAFSAAQVGTKYLITGRYSPQNYFIVALPDGRPCWLQTNTVSVEGNLSGLAELAAPVGSISGRVFIIFNGSENPVPNAKVSIAPAGKSISTDSKGEYSFASVPIGDITVSVNASTTTPNSVVLTLHNGEVLMGVNFPVFRIFPIPVPVTSIPPTPIPCRFIARCGFPGLPVELPTFQSLP